MVVQIVDQFGVLTTKRNTIRQLPLTVSCKRSFAACFAWIPALLPWRNKDSRPLCLKLLIMRKCKASLYIWVVSRALDAVA